MAGLIGSADSSGSGHTVFDLISGLSAYVI